MLEDCCGVGLGGSLVILIKSRFFSISPKHDMRVCVCMGEGTTSIYEAVDMRTAICLFLLPHKTWFHYVSLAAPEHSL